MELVDPDTEIADHDHGFQDNILFQVVADVELEGGNEEESVDIVVKFAALAHHQGSDDHVQVHFHQHKGDKACEDLRIVAGDAEVQLPQEQNVGDQAQHL